jgi:hypothetical protein
MRGGPLISVSSTVAGGGSVRISDTRRYLGNERYGSEGPATIRWMGECGNPPDHRVRLDHSASPTRERLTHRAKFANPDGLATPARPTQKIAPPLLGLDSAQRGTKLDLPPPSGKHHAPVAAACSNNPETPAAGGGTGATGATGQMELRVRVAGLGVRPHRHSLRFEVKTSGYTPAPGYGNCQAPRSWVPRWKPPSSGTG